jgi:hypothetical protein
MPPALIWIKKVDPRAMSDTPGRLPRRGVGSRVKLSDSIREVGEVSGATKRRTSGRNNLILAVAALKLTGLD